MAQLVLANILAGSGNVLAGGDNNGNVTKVTIGSNLTLSGGVLSASGGTSLTLTTTGTSGAATYIGGVLNIPIYSSGSGAVSSVFGRTGAVVATSGDYNTDLVTEGSVNLYYTNARARVAFSANAGSALTYNSANGRFTLNAADGTVPGYVTVTDYTRWDNKQNGLGTGTTSQFLRGDLTWQPIPFPSISMEQLSDFTQVGSLTNGQMIKYQGGSWQNFTPSFVTATYFSATSPLSYNSGTGVFSIAQASSGASGYLSSTDWNTFNGKAYINGTGFVKASGTYVFYDNTSYLSEAGAAAQYLPLTGGTLSGNLTAPSFYESSDIRFKNVLESNPIIDLPIDVIKFNRKDNAQIRYGYSAQQIKAIMPELVIGENELVVNYSDVHTLKIAALERRIAELEAKLK